MKMKRLIIFCLILLLFAMNSQALNAIQLSGDNGRAILQKIAANSTTSNQTDQSNNSTDDLWSWGSVPVGHLLNSSGGLVETPNEIVLFQV
jgi:hypothetical protein